MTPLLAAVIATLKQLVTFQVTFVKKILLSLMFEGELIRATFHHSFVSMRITALFNVSITWRTFACMTNPVTLVQFTIEFLNAFLIAYGHFRRATLDLKRILSTVTFSGD